MWFTSFTLSVCCRVGVRQPAVEVRFEDLSAQSMVPQGAADGGLLTVGVDIQSKAGVRSFELPECVSDISRLCFNDMLFWMRERYLALVTIAMCRYPLLFGRTDPADACKRCNGAIMY